MSMTGVLVRRVLGPSLERATYALEIASAKSREGRVWLCATPVWRVGAYEALRFVSQSETDKLKLANLLYEVAPLHAA